MIRFLLNKPALTNSFAALKIITKVEQLTKNLNIRYFSSGSSSTSSTPGNNSSLAKDVIVFKYDNPRFFHIMNAFAISQFFFWGKSKYS